MVEFELNVLALLGENYERPVMPEPDRGIYEKCAELLKSVSVSELSEHGLAAFICLLDAVYYELMRESKRRSNIQLLEDLAKCVIS